MWVVNEDLRDSAEILSEEFKSKLSQSNKLNKV